MKIPVEWLKQYANTNKSLREIADSFTAIGLMWDKPLSPYENGAYTTEVLDLEHRMDRSDWLSIIGGARDFAAYDNLELKFPELYEEKGATLPENDKVKIEVECPDLVYRFNTRVFKNITVKPSPEWLSNRLLAYGIPSINNIVDITNYVMVELGQPMHAQDLSKMEKREIVIRRAKKGEIIKTLLGETLELDESAFVLTQNGKPTVLGGIVGGSSTGITNETKEIVLDAGNYNQTNIRKSSRRFKIANETVLRYDKFLHPYLCEIAVKRATKLILELAGGDYYDNEDWYPKVWELKQMKLRYSRVKTIGGLDIEPEFIKTTLTRIGYKIVNAGKEDILLEVPYFRTDVEVEDDIVSDVLRIYGYKNIPSAQMNSAPPKEITPTIYKFEEKIRDVLVNLGGHEHITDPLVAEDKAIRGQVVLENAQSSQKNALRTQLIGGLQSVLDTYKKHKIESATVFEIGKSYTLTGDKAKYDNYKETRLTEIVLNTGSLKMTDKATVTKKTLDGFLKQLGFKSYTLNTNEHMKPLVDIEIDGVKVGNISYNTITIYNTILLGLKNGKYSRVEVNYTDDVRNDISVLVDSNLKLGVVIEQLRSTFKSIQLVIVEAQDIECENGTKVYLLEIVENRDNQANLEEIRNTIQDIPGIKLKEYNEQVHY